MTFGQFIGECARVLRITKKPTRKEYFAVVKISGLGIAIIGMLGFIIYLIYQYIFV